MNMLNDAAVLSVIINSKMGTAHYFTLKLQKSANPLSRINVSTALQRLKRKGLVTNDGCIWRYLPKQGGAA
jgi:predicted transcriptional regulator